MSPRPPYRWKSFWLGLFVLAFMSWAWWDGLRNDTRITFAGRVTAWKAGRIDGSTVLVAGSLELVETNPGWNFYREQRRWNLCSWTHYWDASSSADIRYLTIPDFLIVVPCLTAWLTWIGWRLWRSRQLETRSLLRQ
jgi:hypothetical protein